MKYKFISRTLLTNETLKVVSLYLDLKDWGEVKKIVLEENLLQKNKSVSMQKQFSEIKTRLELLPDNLLEYLNTSSLNTANLILLIACVKKYRLLYEFIIEVIRDKYLSFNYSVFEHDFEKLLRDKSLDYPEIDNWKQDTRVKMKRNIFKTLEEGGIIESTETKNIIKPFLPEKLIEIIAKDKPYLLAIFLMSDSEIAIYKDKYYTGDK